MANNTENLVAVIGELSERLASLEQTLTQKTTTPPVKIGGLSFEPKEPSFSEEKVRLQEAKSK